MRKSRSKKLLVFDFLHGLGEAFSETIRPQELHRLIVEGATRILDAHGGALYMTDRTGGKLTPAFISKGCPPLVDVPPNILQQAAATPIALESYLRLHSVTPGEGLIGRVWQTGQSALLERSLRSAGAGEIAGQCALALHQSWRRLCSYGKQDLGVLAVANGPLGAPFSQGDFVVFKSIAEQSAFALYNAIIYSMANEKKRLDHDLEIARDIQRILLPAEAPAINGFQISGINVPARQVSGDYFDYIRVDDERLGVAIADVSGKGVPASLIMAICRSVLRAEAARIPLRPMFSKSEPATLSRYQGRHVYQHGLSHPGPSTRRDYARARRARRAITLQTALANSYAHKAAGNGRRN